GDPLNRVHWRATARTGQLHSKIHEPSTLSGATVLLDFHQAGYHARGEPFRSELAVVAAVSLANAVYEMGQQVGLVTNGRDAAAIALGDLRRRGFAVTVVLVMLDDKPLEQAYARLMSEGVRDLRHLKDEAELADLCNQQVHRATPYDFAGLGG